ncbi:glycosyltransferase [bacterium]|nr:glycosyltransferase [bacterium]
MSCELTILLPVLDEAMNLEVLLPAIHDVAGRLSVSYEILVVDGGSQDGSREIADRRGARTLAQESPGYGGALRDGIRAARGRFILTMDSDLSHDPIVITQLFAARHKADVIVASRYMPGGEADMPRLRYWLSRTLNVVFRFVLSLSVRDVSSGFRLYRAAIFREIDITRRNFDALEEILVKALARGFRLLELPFRYKPRHTGETHARLWAFGRAYLGTLFQMWKLRNSISSADYDYRAYFSRHPYQRFWQRRRFSIIARMSHCPPRILDVGCGSSYMITAFPQAVVCDVLHHKLRFVGRMTSRRTCASVFALPFPDGHFDEVICSQVIEHVPRDERVLDELARVLAPGGRLIIGTPDYGRWQWRVIEWIYARVNPVGYADEHITHYTRETLTRELLRRGLVVEEFRYIHGAELIVRARWGREGGMRR